MQQQASYKQVHAWTGKVLTTVHIGQSNFSEGLRNRLQLSEYTCRVFFSQLGWNNGRWLTHPKKAKHFFKTRSYIKAEVQQNKSLSWDDRGAPTLSKRVWVIKYEWQWVMFTWRLYVYQPQGGAWSTLKCKQGLQSLSVIDAVMGWVVVAGLNWSPDWDFKGALDAYQPLCARQTEEDEIDERRANAPPLLPPTGCTFCSISRPHEPGCYKEDAQARSDQNTHTQRVGWRTCCWISKAITHHFLNF